MRVWNSVVFAAAGLSFVATAFAASGVERIKKVWRLGATHTGHNLGHTNLWVIAVEPK